MTELKENINLLNFFQTHNNLINDYNKMNIVLKAVSGINNFFGNQKEISNIALYINRQDFVPNIQSREYGDFQTNLGLTKDIITYILTKNNNFEFLIEPTCGKGNFILSSLNNIKTLKKVVGIEINETYFWITKLKILNYFLDNPKQPKPEIDIFNSSIFNYNLSKLAEETNNFKTLLIGNPPWVTNTELSILNSTNIPIKNNKKKNSGLDAITGKGNFDIGESILNLIFEKFQYHIGCFAFLIKNSVIKNIIYEQKRTNYKLEKLEKLIIDTKKEFDASVDSTLFFGSIGNSERYNCKEFNFYSKRFFKTFGWYKNKFVSSIEDYESASLIEGKSSLEWRSGIKHDCSSVMELTKFNGHYKNNLDEVVIIEENLLYGFLKSSDLKKNKVNSYRKLTIITQKKTGDETSYIKELYPLTYKYLASHSDLLQKRKSSVYKDKPQFSIFGVGEYSFSKYKVAISGLYKTSHFTLINPNESKSIILDDTCYFIGFENLKMAEIAHFILNSELVQNFLKAIIFFDSKRAINKDVLMRIDIYKVFKLSSYELASKNIQNLNFNDWKCFEELVFQKSNNQVLMF